MKAAFIEKFGDSSVIQLSKDFPKPKLETDTDILVQVHAASLNPLDWKFRSGMTSIIMSYKFPQILGHDFSGIVLNVGKKVQKFKKGDEVSFLFFFKKFVRCFVALLMEGLDQLQKKLL